MKRKYAETLAKEYDFETRDEFFDYIIDSLINGNRDQVKKLFNQMKSCDQSDFLINHLDNNTGYHISCRNICIGELCK